MSRKKIDSRINKYNNFLKVDSVTGEVKGQINNIEIEEIYINSDGKLLQDTINISKETGASTATISRVNKCLSYGEGGYKTVLDRIKGE